MDLPDLHPHIETLTQNIDSLEEALTPLFKEGPHHLASKLPLLDKSKLFVSTAYTIESLIFSSLLLSGASPKTHPIFTELTRLRQYHEKIKVAENPSSSDPRVRLDKGAAARFIKHGLSGNDRYDAERAERVAREKEGVSGRTPKPNHIRFEEQSGGRKVVEGHLGTSTLGAGKKRKAPSSTKDAIELEKVDAMATTEDAPMLDADTEVADQEPTTTELPSHSTKRARISSDPSSGPDATSDPRIALSAQRSANIEEKKINEEEVARQKERKRAAKREHKRKDKWKKAEKTVKGKDEELIVPDKEKETVDGVAKTSQLSERLQQLIDRPKVVQQQQQQLGDGKRRKRRGQEPGKSA